MWFIFSGASGLILLQSLAVGAVITSAAYFRESEIIAYVEYGKSSEDIFVLDVDRGTAHNLTGHMDKSHEGELEWSPDGLRIAFTARDDETNMADIFVMNMDGGTLRQLTPRDTEYNFSPGWSPDSQQIMFVAYKAGNTDIYVMDADGSDVRPLTHSHLTESAPAWSPDGRLIAFGLAHESTYYISIVEAADGDEQQLIPGNFTSPIWSPDGTQIAFMRVGFQACIYVMDIDDQSFRSFASPGGLYSFTWLPDSQHIAFVSDVVPGGGEVYVVDTATSSQYLFPFGGYSGYVPVWRPT